MRFASRTLIGSFVLVVLFVLRSAPIQFNSRSVRNGIPRDGNASGITEKVRMVELAYESRRLAYHIRRFFNEKSLSDAVVQYRGQEYQIHKVIVAAQSPFFEKMFTGPWKVRLARILALL